MAMKRFRAALAGQGGYLNALRSCWATRFYSIRATVETTGSNHRLEMVVTHDSAENMDMVTLVCKDDVAGEVWVLYAGSFTGGTLKRKRLPRD